MNKIIKSTAVVAAAVVAAAGLATTAQATTGTTVTIRSGGLDLADTRANGHVAFLKDGLHVWTDGNTDDVDLNSDGTGDHYAGWSDKAAGYFAVTGPLPTNATLTWYGSQPQPGQQIVVDADNNGTADGILVGEPVYNGGWWLTNSSAQALKDGAPHVGGGYGSDFYGTLTEWAASFPQAHILAGGFSLGSGVKGDGVVDSITYGDTTYRFTSETEAPTPVVTDVTGYATKTIGTRGFRLELYSVTQPDNTVVGKKLTWKVLVDGQRVFSTEQGFGDHDTVAIRFPAHSGKHVVDLYKNGVKARHFTVTAH